MKKDLLKVSIRQHAIYLPAIEGTEKREALTSTTVTLVAQLRKVGYSLSEELLHAVNQLYPAQQVEILQVMKEVLGVSLNWAPLVKGWDTPTLREVWRTAPYLFDGRAATMKEVFDVYKHCIDKKISSKEADELAEYVNSL